MNSDDKLDLDFSKEKAVINTEEGTVRSEPKNKKAAPKKAAPKKAEKEDKVDDETQKIIQQKVAEELAKQRAVRGTPAFNPHKFIPEGQENKSAPAVNPAGLRQKTKEHPFIPEGETNPSAPPVSSKLFFFKFKYLLSL